MNSNSELVLSEHRGLSWSHLFMVPLFLAIIAACAVSFWLWQQSADTELAPVTAPTTFPTTVPITAPTTAPDIQGSFHPQATAVSAFQLFDANGEPFTQANLQGRWSILFFGFTSCPHICPANMTQLTRVYADLQQQNPDVELPQVVFVSVDPQTDKLDRLKEFIGHFDPSFQAIGGSDAALAPLEQSLDVSHQAGTPRPSGFYFVDHSNLLHLIDPEGRVVADFAPPFTQEGLRQDYLRAVRFLKARS